MWSCATHPEWLQLILLAALRVSGLKGLNFIYFLNTKLFFFPHRLLRFYPVTALAGLTASLVLLASHKLCNYSNRTQRPLVCGNSQGLLGSTVMVAGRV